MNIAVITFHCSYNYGSVLQAYALQTYLEKQGHRVQIIDYILSSDFKQYKLLRFDRYLRKPQYLISDIYFLPRTIKRKQNFNAFKTLNLHLTDKKYYDDDNMAELNQKFDAFICGSDQIWNTACTKQVVPPYFLSFADDDKLKIAYAPSVAQIHDTTSNVEMIQMKQYIGRLDHISVREKSTVSYIAQFTDRDVIDVLDPTLLLERADYDTLISQENFDTKFQYIFFYTLQKNNEMIDYCQKLSEKKNLKVLYISKNNIGKFHSAKNIYGCSPQAFLNYIKNAEYIVTNSFHATVFSVIFEKKFCTFGTKKSYVRMSDLLKEIGLEKRMYKNNSFNIDDEIDYSNVQEKKSALAKSSKDFLNDSLN